MDLVCFMDTVCILESGKSWNQGIFFSPILADYYLCDLEQEMNFSVALCPHL